MTLRDFLTNVARTLADVNDSDPAQSFTHWPLLQLLTWYNEAQCIIAEYKPQDFTVTKVLRLQGGSTQNPCCKMVGDVTEYVAADGAHIAYVRPLAKKQVGSWRGKNCQTDAEYAPTNVWRIDNSTTSFEVFPPVPNTGEYYVKIRCVESPKELTFAEFDTQLTCRYSPATAEWMLWKALSGDTDTAMHNVAQMHAKMFFDLMGVQQRSEQNFFAKQQAQAKAPG